MSELKVAKITNNGAPVDFAIAPTINGEPVTTAADNTPADDGASGSLWSTVQGFITYVQTSFGTSLRFLQAGTGAIARLFQAKARDEIHTNDYGADNTGATDATADLLDAFTYAISQKRPLILEGTYLVSGRITPADAADQDLHIIAKGEVKINVAAGATAFNDLLRVNSTTINNASITGGSLTIDCANKAANGLYIRHTAAANGGTVNITAVVTVKNCKNNNASDVNENQGIAIIGRYMTVYLNSPVVDVVDRTNTSGGATKGISVIDLVGQCTIDSPRVRRALCTGSTVDADGISVFGLSSGGGNTERLGTVQINNPVMIDCQGRSLKVAAAEAIVVRPRCYRKEVVSIGTFDIDMQMGGSNVIEEPLFDYRKNGGVSPIASTWIPIAFTNRTTDLPAVLRVKGGTLRSEVSMPHLAYYNTLSTSLDGAIELCGVEMQSLGGLGAIITTAVLGCHAGNIQAATGNSFLRVHGVRGNFSGAPVIGYDTASAANTSKLRFEVTDNENTGAASNATTVIANKGGATSINQVGRFRVFGNKNVSDHLGGWVFDALALPAWSSFSYNRTTATVTNGPTISSGTYVHVESLGKLAAATATVRMTLDDVSGANSVFFSQVGGWGTIK